MYLVTIRDVIIVGAGPSGISAAVQLKRYNIEALLLEKDEVGGLLKNANLVENYPGFPRGISGEDLVKLFKQQLEEYEIETRFENVLKIDFENDVFTVVTNKGIHLSSSIVIASGTKPRRIPSAKIAKGADKKVFYEIHKLYNVAGKSIAIIGAGDAAFDYALSLSKNNKVVIFNKGRTVKCLPLLWKRAINSRNISYFAGVRVDSVNCHKSGLLLSCNDIVHGDNFEVYTSYLVIAVGREPCLDFLSGRIRDELEKLQRMHLLYMIGDVKNGIYRQVAIAVGDGIKSAMEIHEKLRRIIHESDM